jgi:hypothetical protein
MLAPNWGEGAMCSAQPPKKSALLTALSALLALAVITTATLLADRAVAQGDAISQARKTEKDRPGTLETKDIAVVGV